MSGEGGEGEWAGRGGEVQARKHEHFILVASLPCRGREGGSRREGGGERKGKFSVRVDAVRDGQDGQEEGMGRRRALP